MFLYIQANVRFFFRIPIKLTSGSTSYSTPYSNFSWDHLRPHSFLFYTRICAEGQVFSLSQSLTLCLFLSGPFQEGPFILYKAFLRPLFTWTFSLSLPSLNVFTERIVASSPAASSSPFLFSLRRLYYPY